MLTFAIVGSGRRAEFFLRLAAAMPDRLRVSGIVSRQAERRAAISERWGVSAFSTLDDLLAHESPLYIAALVSWQAMPAVIRAVVERGIPVLSETPPAPDLDSLRRLWDDVGSTRLVQVDEQYRLMPTHAARLAVVHEGTIGTVTSVQISSTHLYHAVSLMRAYLDAPAESTRVFAQSFEAPLVDPLGFDGWTHSAEPKSTATTLATIDFGGLMGLYDFTDNQWWNPLRTTRIVVRGSHGEMVDDHVIRLTDPSTPIVSRLERRQSGVDLDLELLDLKYITFDGRVVYRNPFPGYARSDDDIAVADLLARVGEWARDDGPPPYGLADASEDHLVSLAILDSVRTGAPVVTTEERWRSSIVSRSPEVPRTSRASATRPAVSS